PYLSTIWNSRGAAPGRPRKPRDPDRQPYGRGPSAVTRSVPRLGLEHPQQLVLARAPVDRVGDAYEVLLLEERDPRPLLGHDVRRLVEHLGALGGVHLGLRGVHELVEALVAPADAVGVGAVAEERAHGEDVVAHRVAQARDHQVLERGGVPDAAGVGAELE